MLSTPSKAVQDAIAERSTKSFFSQLWSDALFAREQAREAEERVRSVTKWIAEQVQPLGGDVAALEIHEKNLSRERAKREQARCDRGSFVRWTVTAAWMAFEKVCETAVGKPKANGGLIVALSSALVAKKLNGLDLTQGLWMDADGVRKKRNKCAHGDDSTPGLYAELSTAEDAIIVLRTAAKDLNARVSKPYPPWIDCDTVPKRLGGTSSRGGTSDPAAEADADALRLVAVIGESEWQFAHLLHTADPWPSVEQYIKGTHDPICAIRVYSGSKLLHDLAVKIRGA